MSKWSCFGLPELYEEAAAFVATEICHDVTMYKGVVRGLACQVTQTHVQPSYLALSMWPS